MYITRGWDPQKTSDEVVPIFHMPMEVVADFGLFWLNLAAGLEPTGDGGVDFSLLGHVFFVFWDISSCGKSPYF